MKVRLLLLLSVLCFFCAGAVRVYADASSSENSGIITAISDADALQDLAPVTIWDDDQDELLSLVLAWKTVEAQAVSPDGESCALSLPVDWSSALSGIDYAVPGTYTLTCPLTAPEGYIFGEGVLSALTVSVTVEAGSRPQVITDFSDLSHQFGFAVAVDSDWQSFFDQQLSLWEYVLPCRTEAGGTAYVHVQWRDPQPDLSAPQVLTIRGDAVLPDGITSAPGTALPELTLSVSVQDRPTLDCWYLSNGVVFFPWVGGGVEEQAQVLLSQDGGDFAPVQFAGCNSGSVYLPANLLETGHAYAVKAVWDGGETGAAAFVWDGTLRDFQYITGDRDGSGEGTQLPDVEQPAPPVQDAVTPDENDGANAGHAHDTAPVPESDQDTVPEPESDQEQEQEPALLEPPASERAPLSNSDSASAVQPESIEEDTGTGAVLSGTRLLALASLGEDLVLQKGQAAATLPAALLTSLSPTDQDRFSFTLTMPDAASVDFSVTRNDSAVTSLPGLRLSISYRPASADAVFAVLDQQDTEVTQADYEAGRLTFTVDSPGLYRIQELTAVQAPADPAPSDPSEPANPSDAGGGPASAEAADTGRAASNPPLRQAAYAAPIVILAILFGMIGGLTLRSRTLPQIRRTLPRVLLAAALTIGAASALCLGLYRWDNKYTLDASQPIAGTLFVSEEDWSETPCRFLWNGWLFYPDVLLTPETYDDRPDTAMSVQIGAYSNFAFGSSSQNPHGSGTYVLTLILPETPHIYALELPEIFSAYRLYVNGVLAAQMGDADAYTPVIQSQLVTFEASGTVQLLLAVRDESSIFSGMVYAPAFGEPAALGTVRALRIFLSAAAVAISLLFAVLALWFIRSRTTRHNAVLFCLLCLSIALLLSYPAVHAIFPMGSQPWYTVELANLHVLTLLLLLLHNRICGVPRTARILSASLAGLVCLWSLLYGICAAQLTQPMVQRFATVEIGFKLAVTAYLLLTVLLVSDHWDSKTAPLFCAELFYAAVFLWSLLLPSYEPIVGGWFQEWGSLVLAICLGVILWKKVFQGYRRSLTLAEEQRQMQRQLEIQQLHYRQISEQVDHSRRLRHDFRQHLRTIAALADKPEEQLAYIQKIAAVQLPGQIQSYCGDSAVDALLYYYDTAARQSHIPFTVKVELPPDKVLPSVALGTILGNLLENALEACQRQAEGAQFIRLTIKWQFSKLYLAVENSYDGKVDRRDGRFFSRKRRGVGVGLSSVEALAAKLGGSAEFRPEADRFLAVVILDIGRRA